jgi:hypothetical protein
MDPIMSSLNPLRPVNLSRVKNSCSIGDETAVPGERNYCQNAGFLPAPDAAKELESIPNTLAAIVLSLIPFGCSPASFTPRPDAGPSNPDAAVPDAGSITDTLPPDLLLGGTAPDTALPDFTEAGLAAPLDAEITADTLPSDALVELDAGLLIPDDASPDLTAPFDAGIIADAFPADSFAGPDSYTLSETGLPPGFGPNSCPINTLEEKALVDWPQLDSVDNVPINTSPPNTSFFKAHPILMEQARQVLGSIRDGWALAGHEHWLDGIQRKGIMLFDIPSYDVPARQGLGLEAYPYSPFLTDTHLLGLTTESGFGDLGTPCNEGIQVFYRLLHAPYEYKRTLAHEFIHWIQDQWLHGEPGAPPDSIDFSPTGATVKNCYSGTDYGEFAVGPEENRAEYVSLAVFFPSSQSILAEADQLLGCDPAITSARKQIYQQIYELYFNGLTPPAESASVQAWLQVALFRMRGLQNESLAEAKSYIEANPNDADGIKSIYYNAFARPNPGIYSQTLPAVPYQGGTYSGTVEETSFPAEYRALIDEVINNPVNPAGVPYPEEVIRYSLWYKAMMEAYPKNTISINPSSGGQTIPVYSESGLSAAKNTLSVLTGRIASDDHPLTGEIGLLTALIDYWSSNKPLKTSIGIQFPATGYDAGTPADTI